MIVDLSFPNGRSVSDGIDAKLCSLRYTSVDTVCRTMLFLSQGAMLTKFDILGAFRTVPVHPDDHWLLGIHWESCIHMDKVLPFGLCSAPNCITQLQIVCCGFFC